MKTVKMREFWYVSLVVPVSTKEEPTGLKTVYVQSEDGIKTTGEFKKRLKIRNRQLAFELMCVAVRWSSRLPKVAKVHHVKVKAKS